MRRRLSVLAGALLLLVGSSSVAEQAINTSQKNTEDDNLVLFSTTAQGARPLGVEQERYLAFGQSIFNFYGNHQFQALSQLLQNKKRGLFNEETDYASLLMGELYIAYGLPKPANAIVNKLLAEDILTRTRAETWLHKAKLHYQKGKLDKAEDILERDKVDGLAPEQGVKRDLMFANVLIAQGRFHKAEDILAKVPDSSPKRIFADYNIAVAMIRNKRIEEGLELLADIYHQPPGDSHHNAVQDRAALTAGLVNVKHEHYNAALKALANVRKKGPFSSDAMLIMGLAFYKAGAYRSAIPLWTALINRSSSNASVQEALSLTPKAYEKLGALKQALTGYRYAAKTYRRELQKIESVSRLIAQGKWLKTMLPSRDKVLQNPDPMYTMDTMQDHVTAETPYLYGLFSSREFALKFKQYQQIRRLGILLEGWKDQLTVMEQTAKRQKQYLNRVLTPVRAKLVKLNRAHQQLVANVHKLRLPRRLNMDRIDTLASYPQWVMWQSVQRLQHSQWRGTPRLRHLRGLLLWDIAHDAEANVKQFAKDRAALLKATTTLSTRLATTNQLVEDANAHLHNQLAAQFSSKRATINKLLKEDAQTLKLLRNYMKIEAGKVLRKIRTRLIGKLAMANLSIARLQDKSLTQPDNADGGDS